MECTRPKTPIKVAPFCGVRQDEMAGRLFFSNIDGMRRFFLKANIEATEYPYGALRRTLFMSNRAQQSVEQKPYLSM